ncbi:MULTISPECIES: hypothetical protein [unclassified Acinetobacter]|uniref:hypothetical protein n=1 Tax=unclassified Acinetobacter TaxID=196816 RepID=UPI0035B763FE
MKMTSVLLLAVASLATAGCSKMAIGNGSLDYKKNVKTMPLQLPENVQMRQPQALYPAPQIPEEALKNAPNLVNSRGNRFDLSRPDRAASSAVVTGRVSSVPSQPQAIMDGSQNVMLLINGERNAIWERTMAAVKASGLQASLDAKTTHQYNIVLNNHTYQLRLGDVSTGSVLAVFDNQRYANDGVSKQILENIAIHWPQ